MICWKNGGKVRIFAHGGIAERRGGIHVGGRPSPLHYMTIRHFLIHDVMRLAILKVFLTLSSNSFSQGGHSLENLGN